MLGHRHRRGEGGWNDPLNHFFIFKLPRKYQLFNMLKIKRDINQQDFKIIDLHFRIIYSTFNII